MQINSINNSTFGMAKTTPSSEQLLKIVANSPNKDVQDAIYTIRTLHPQEIISIANKPNEAGDYVVLTNRFSQKKPYIYLALLNPDNFEETILKAANKMKTIDNIRKSGIEFYL